MAKAKRKPKVKLDARTVVFLEIISLLLTYNDAEKKRVAEEAGVHWTTIYNWTHGATLNPHIGTLVKVAEVLGYEVALRRIKGKKPPFRS